MSHRTAATAAHTIGIDMGKNTLHLIGLDDKGAIVLREKVSSRPDRTSVRQCAAVPDRNRSWHGDALCGPRAKCARP
jgi:predicted NBD/HSP70 family sugar kinase